MMSFFVILGLLVCTEAQGSSDVTRVFVQKGKDVRLDVKEPVRKQDFSWKFNKSHIMLLLFRNIEPIFFNNYSERAEFFAQNCSLLLKNVQHKDSGVYTGVVSGSPDQTVAEYTIIVKDPVSPVHLTVNPISSDPCKLTVTCRAEDSHITSTFTCDTQTCSQEGRERSGVTIDVYVQQDFIICNHSNQVSWKESEKIQFDCGPQSGPQTFSLCLVKIVVFTVGLIIMVSAVITVHLMERFKKQKQSNSSLQTKCTYVNHQGPTGTSDQN